jgi:anaerobic magnesium-protoporphyrin IX monomethyl ester cyclase
VRLWTDTLKKIIYYLETVNDFKLSLNLAEQYWNNMLDKDTWIAQNLIPKNDAPQSAHRKLRAGVTSVGVNVGHRKTKMTLCVLGSWAIYMPPYNLARLTSLMREAGYPTIVYDFNVESHYRLKEANPSLDDAWNGANYWWWQGDEYYKRIHTTYEPILKEYLEILLEDNPDIIGFSTYYTNLLPTKWMINEIRKRRPDITIVMGGPECHENYYKKPQNVDYYFIGESEQNILDFLENWENGIKPLQPAIGGLYSDTRIDIDSLPYPDYSDFDLTKYWGKNSICAEISRGCIAKCSYCTEVYYWKFRDRGAQTVVDELEHQVKKYGISFVSFVDSLMNGNLKEFRNFCQALVDRKLGINWWGYARADGRMDLEFYKLMKAAGAQGFNYGVETGSDKVLKAINKKNTVAEINQNIIDSDKVGMKVSACWVIGAPGEDIEAFTHSFNMLWNHRARIIACSPGPGLGDNMGSAYDDREKFNINPRNKPWLGAWYSLDLMNTKLHRHIRIKLMHIWLYLCKEYGGTITNVHSSEGDITDHFELTFDSEYINDHVEYENFDFNIIKSGHGDFADSVMNEVFGFFRMLWRVRGGFEMTLNFNPEVDHRDFIFTIAADSHTYTADLYFKIDDFGNFTAKCNYYFVNNYKDVVDMDGFEYVYEASGQWKEATKTKVNKIFYIKSEVVVPNVLPIEHCFSSISVEERFMLLRTSKYLKEGSVVLETNSGLGGRAAILARANKNISIHSIETFGEGSLKSEFDSTQSWIKEQLFDACKENGVAQEIGYELLKALHTDFDNDASGKSAWKRITSNYPNIILQDKSILGEFSGWETPLDICLINTHHNPTFENNLEFWSNHVKPNGYIIAHLYHKTYGPDVVKGINNLLTQRWKVVEQVGTLICIQRITVNLAAYLL